MLSLSHSLLPLGNTACTLSETGSRCPEYLKLASGYAMQLRWKIDGGLTGRRTGNLRGGMAGEQVEVAEYRPAPNALLAFG